MYAWMDGLMFVCRYVGMDGLMHVCVCACIFFVYLLLFCVCVCVFSPSIFLPGSLSICQSTPASRSVYIKMFNCFGSFSVMVDIVGL